MSRTLTLPSELTIYGVAALRAQCLDWLASTGGDAAVVDGAAVDEVDAAGLQLLVALSHSAAAAGQPLRWAAQSTALRAARDALGLDATLGPVDGDGAVA